MPYITYILFHHFFENMRKISVLKNNTCDNWKKKGFQVSPIELYGLLGEALHHGVRTHTERHNWDGISHWARQQSPSWAQAKDPAARSLYFLFDTIVFLFTYQPSHPCNFLLILHEVENDLSTASLCHQVMSKPHQSPKQQKHTSVKISHSWVHS